MSDLDTGPFLSISQNFQEHLFYWTLPVVAFSNFKAPGFTETVMQMNFWITHDLAHLSILSSSWHFCVYFRQAQAFRCIPTASLTLDILYFFWQRRIEISWYLDQPISFCANLYRKNQKNNQYPAKFGTLRPYESGDITSLSCYVTKWSMCHVTLWAGFPQRKSPDSYV